MAEEPKDKGKLKKTQGHFAQVSNEALRDPNLTLKAKGLYSLIKSYITIEGFTLYKNHLRKQCTEGEGAFNNAWKELIEKKYLIQTRKRQKDGTFKYEHELKEKKDQGGENHLPDNPPTGKGGQYNNIITKKTLKKNIKRNNGVLRGKTHTQYIEEKLKTDGGKQIYDFMNYYMDVMYTTKTKQKHPNIKDEQTEKIFSTLEEFIGLIIYDEYNVFNILKEIAQQHFKTTYSKGTDWNINHFATEGILGHRYSEVYGLASPYQELTKQY